MRTQAESRLPGMPRRVPAARAKRVDRVTRRPGQLKQEGAGERAPVDGCGERGPGPRDGDDNPNP